MDFELPNSRDVVTRYLLERNACEQPDKPSVSFEDGTTWSRKQSVNEAYAAANALRDSGVRQGDAVAVMLTNGPDFLRAWWGVSTLGAILVPIHTAFQGHLLAHALTISKPAAIVGAPDLMKRVDEIADQIALPKIRLVSNDLRSRNIDPPRLERPIEFWDPMTYVLTSGTTGPSKLSANSYLSSYLGGANFIVDRGRGEDDVFLVDLPLFHGAALRHAGACLAARTALVIQTIPKLSEYWERARDAKVTMSLLISTMVPYLVSQPSRPAEREHSIRIVLAGPLPADSAAFMKRFGIDEIHTGFGMTEVPGPITMHPHDEPKYGYCGRTRRGYQCLLVDDHDMEVPKGQPGQLIVRSEHPWMISTEYIGDSQATAIAWRNGWFHTGDMLRQDPEERYFFVDRVKDSLRRRGENISSVEVETEMRKHPAVVEAACVPYRTEYSVDDEVKVWIVVKEGASIDYEDLLSHCATRLPYFMVPRYFEQIAEFPKTPSSRIKKNLLREMGNSNRTWDREEFGLQVTREGLMKKTRT